MALSLIILQGPSASGKSTLQSRLGLPRIVTWTSRSPRDGETEGVDYFFGDREQIQSMYDTGELLEITEYQGNLYGTSLTAVSKAIQSKTPHSVVLDAPGASRVKELYKDKVLLIGIYAEKEQCRARLADRGVPEEEAARRLASYEEETQRLFQCDVIIPNTDKRFKHAEKFMLLLKSGLTQPWD